MSSTQQGSSISAFLSTLIPVAAQAGVFAITFLLLRGRMKRIYRPRTYLATVPEPLRSEDPPKGRLNWFRSFFSFSDEYVINHQSLDGYLYLRFLKMLCFICFVGCCITWPVLFPVNATAGGPGKEFDLLSFANVPKSQKNRYYAHVFIGWIFFTFVLYIITREYIYFINLRNAYLLSPFHAARISSRTVLFTDVPAEYLHTGRLQELFGASFCRAWINPDTKELDGDVEKREKAALKLEGAEINLSKKANKRRIKAEKKRAKGKGGAAKARHTEKGPRRETTPGDSAATMTRNNTNEQGGAWTTDGADRDVERNNFLSDYLLPKDRPKHRLGIWKIPFVGKKVDTIDWSRSELRTLNPRIDQEQTKLRRGQGNLLPAVFVEFATQKAAQAAFRRMSLWKSPNMYPRAISTTPDNIIWKNLRIKKRERSLRKIGTNTFLTLMILFWTIPVAVIGAISNINYLTDKVPFLSFINHIPTVILGVVTGLLPSILLSVLMSLVPVVCRLMARIRGEVTLADVELRCQHWYMAFQVVQVFLITTFASGASSVVTQIINKPSSATTLLAENLPKASNFFISYVIVQMLGIAASNLLNIGALVMIRYVGKYLDSSPRKIFRRYITLAGLGWGTLYPQFGNLGIIALAYSIIAPLLMGFACVGFALTYFAMRYNLFYVLGNGIDTHGRAYARGMQQLMTGVYLAEVCLIGLFAINTAPGPIVLMVIFLVFTAIYHAMMRNALKPLANYLPDSLGGAEFGPSFNFADHHTYDAAKANGVPPSEWISPKPSRFMLLREKLYTRLFAPQKRKSYHTAQSLIDRRDPPTYLESEEQAAYFHPSLTNENPKLWIVRDPMGISAKECHDSGEVATISDSYADLNEKNKISWDRDAYENDPETLPVYEKEVEY